MLLTDLNEDAAKIPDMSQLLGTTIRANLLSGDELDLSTPNPACSVTWTRTKFAEYQQLSRSTTWVDMVACHFPRERAHCPQGRTFWARLLRILPEG